MMAGNSSIGTTTPRQDSNTSLASDYMDGPGGDAIVDPRPVTASRPTLGRSGTKSTTSSSNGTSFVTVASTASEPNLLDEDAEERQHGVFHNTLSRHLSQLTLHTRHKEGIDGDTEESHKKKRTLLLGKKMFGNQ